jgi:chitodextrinase
MANFLFKIFMNRRLLTLTLLLSGLILTYFNIAGAAPLADRLKGYILLQVQSRGEAWYVIPTESKRTYLANGETAYAVMSKLGLGITNANLKKIPVGLDSRIVDTDSDRDGLGDKLEEGLKTNPNNIDSDGDGYDDFDEVTHDYSPLGKEKNIYDQSLVNSLKGKILLQVEEKGQAWYVHPVNGRRYYMKDGPSAYEIMRFLSLGITNTDLSQIPVSSFSAGVPTTIGSSDSQAPTAPSNLTASATSTQITLNWSASTDNIAVTQYRLERSTSANTGFSFVTTVSGRNYTNTGLIANTTYYYRVQATDAAGNVSSYSNVASGRTGQLIVDLQAPSIPSNFTATATSTQITLNWSASTDNVGVVQYQIERSTSATTGFTSLNAVSVNFYTNTGLNTSTKYYYRIRAVDAAGNLSAYSSIVNATTGAQSTTPPPTGDTQAPTAPSNLTASSTAAQVTLNWSVASDNTAVTGYKVMRSNTSGSAYVLVNNATSNTYIDSSLNAGTYYYVVTAYDAVGNVSANSNQAQVVVAGTTPPVQYVSISQPYVDKIVVANIEASENTAYNWYKNGVQAGSGNSATTFLAHFDGDLKTANDESPLSQSGVSYATSKYGQGMKGKAEYTMANNLKFDEGTIEFWLTLDQPLSSSVYNAEPYIFKYINPVNYQKIMMNIKTDISALVFTVHSGTTDVDWSEAVQINTRYNDISANQPVFLAMTYSKSANKSSLYLNGFKISQDDFSGFNFDPANSNLVIGHNNAVVDEFRVSNKALSAEEIMQNYTRGTAFGSNEVYYAATKNTNDSLQLNINVSGANYTANAVVKNSKINSISPDAYVLSNRNSINLSFNTASAATCRYGTAADNFTDLSSTASGTGTSHSINYAVTSVVPSHDFYIKCQNGTDGDDYAFYRRLRVLPALDDNWPKIGSITWGNSISDSEVAGLAKFDMISLAKDNLSRSSLLRKIKENNPKIILLPYVNAPDNNISYGVSSFPHQDFFEKLSDTWRLRNAQGQYVTNLHFPNVMNYNLLTSLPWAEALSQHVKDDVVSRGDWDGVWYDVVDTNFWWIYNYQLNRFTQYPDFDLDGVNEDLNILADYNKARNIWVNGMAEIMTLSRQAMGQDVIIVGNNGDANANLYSGKMWERFLYYHESTFTNNLSAYLSDANSNSFVYWNNNTAAPHLNWNLFEMDTFTNYRRHRLGLGASLLGSVYYNPANRNDYRQLYWYDEFWVNWDSGEASSDASQGRGYLGQPVSDPYTIGSDIWRRDFQHGIVVVNSSASSATIDLGDTFRYIKGYQDVVANSGGTVSELVLPSYDARILLTTKENDPLVGL